MRYVLAVLRLASVAIAIGLLAPASAEAFERTRVDTDPSRAIFWRFRTVGLHTAVDTSEDVPPSGVQAALEASIATWNAAGSGCSDLQLVDEGYPTTLGTNLSGAPVDRQNRIVWREDRWPADPDALALATVVYRRSTGEIQDADIDLNGAHHLFTTTDDPDAADNDVANTLTHELGHLIGLEHVEDPDATMYGLAPPGDLAKRTLSEDEVEAVCFIYPEGRLSPTAPRLPGTGLSNGCAAGPGRTRSVAAGLILLAALRLRRRRAAHR